MKYLNLETFTDFVCTGSECPFTCCGGGWSISIDEETDRYYRSVKGEMGKRLRDCICRDDGSANFILDDSGNCPFLNDRGLCDIYINLGEEHLSNTCTYYPRYMFYSGDICFAGVSISCPVVAEFFLTKKEALQIDFAEDDLSATSHAEMDWELFNRAIRVFTCSVAIAQNRSLAIRERLAMILLFIYRFQSHVEDDSDPDVLINLFSDPSVYSQLIAQTITHDHDYPSIVSFFSEVLGLLKSIDRLKERLPEMAELEEYFDDPSNSSTNIESLKSAFDQINDDSNCIWQENVIVYVFFKYFMKGYKDKDFWGKTLTGLVLIYNLMIMNIAFYQVKNGYEAPQEYKVMCISRISRLVEHSLNFQANAMECFKNKNMLELDFMLRLIS